MSKRRIAIKRLYCDDNDKEIISTLEMLGGRCEDSTLKYLGYKKSVAYYIDFDMTIVSTLRLIEYDYDFYVFTLEEFETYYPYKTGYIAEYLLPDDNETRKTTITGMRWDEDEWTVLYFLEDGNTVMLDNSSDDEEVVNERRDIDINKEQPDVGHVQEYRVINMNKEPAAYKVEIVLGDYDLTVSDGRVFLVRKQ